ncbi:helix-turn-helix domain-containing protein [Paenibacillus sp. FSL R7-0652]|uniref:winged helix-turn-helix transcriptional regulator n=1 Tax=Paenibacillus sp. FSL R7-0652 TaxID=2921687 RepID=UPI00315A3ED8
MPHEETEKHFTAYRIIGTKWTIHILFTLYKGPKKFSELARSIPLISEMVLTRRLKDLQQDGLVRKISCTEQRRIFYELTPKGAALASFIPCLIEWTRLHNF